MRTRLAAAVLVLLLLATCTEERIAVPKKSTAKAYDARLKEVDVDVFAGMDGPNLQLTGDELRGRTVWNLWSGDNAGLWNYLAQNGYGTTDLLKTLDSRRRHERFGKMGLINQPGFASAAKPDDLGLFLDVAASGDPDGAIDAHIDEYTYGRSSGVVGLRLFRNPEFNAAAEAEWRRHIAADGINHDYYENVAYYTDRKLVRPYMVGMACAFCHVGPDPIRPPADPEHPKWENLNDYIGSQYMRGAEVFASGHDPSSFVWQLLNSWQPGTIDTSFIATDHLNNPGTMNALFNLPQRLSAASDERVKGGALALLNVHDPMRTPRVLKDGADSVGFNAALSRVYVNIGEDWREWIRHFNPLIGGLPRQTPIDVATMQRTSPHWNWSEERMPQLAAYLVKVAKPLRLAEATQDATLVPHDAAQLARGRIVFAENCAGCHSSKQPPANLAPRSPEWTQWFRDQAEHDPHFFDDNFLGDERRHGVDGIGTNAVRAAGTNAIRGHVWDNFSSETYKTLPAVKPIEVYDPFTKATSAFPLPAGGPGYYRPPSLVGIWATAPFFHNNALGTFTGDPSVKGRLRAFDDAVEKLLWPEKRLGVKSILRTTATSWINVPASYVPAALGGAELRVGPIPRDTPVNLLANINLDANIRELGTLGIEIVRALKDVKGMSDAEATARLRGLVPLLMKANKCPDFIEDKGHLFGTKLPDSDKHALIALLKTF